MSADVLNEALLRDKIGYSEYQKQGYNDGDLWALAQRLLEERDHAQELSTLLHAALGVSLRTSGHEPSCERFGYRALPQYMVPGKCTCALGPVIATYETTK